MKLRVGADDSGSMSSSIVFHQKLVWSDDRKDKIDEGVNEG